MNHEKRNKNSYQQIFRIHVSQPDKMESIENGRNGRTKRCQL